MRNIYRLKLAVLVVFCAALAALMLAGRVGGQTAYSFSSGPPAGHTGAPSEFNCAECHLIVEPGAGRLSVSAPPTYVPGQTYQITVRHTNADATRVRWGFQLTALAADNTKAGELWPTDALTQLTAGGPDMNSPRQYIEHTSAGTFAGQRDGAAWTFNWTAPAVDVGPITFYVAGNQANGDGNTSGDFIYTTFVSALPSSSAADIAVTASPSPLTLVPGAHSFFNLQTTPSGNFTGDVRLVVSGLPAEAAATFSSEIVTISNPFPVNSTLSITTSPNVAPGTYPLTITATAAGLQRTASASLIISGAPRADLGVAVTGSPNPATLNSNLSYRITVTNHGPGPANNVTVTDALPANVALLSATPLQGACSGGSSLRCNLGALARGASATIALTVKSTALGQIINTAAVTATEIDPNTMNNLATAFVNVDAPGAGGPAMLDASLAVRTIVSGLEMPTGFAFLGAHDLLVTEKASGKVRRVRNGQLQTNAVLDLAVNNASERGLLGIALHPQFATNNFVYLFWTESTTGADSGNLDEVPTLGNRVDRYRWNGSALAFDKNIIKLRAYQADAGQPLRGNHNGGVLRFGPDRKLYVVIGDNGRRGLLQNLSSGVPVPDDQFGGPEPGDAHLTGVILRLNDDGTAPADNPFYGAGANWQKVFAYGIRNSFGLAFDPVGGRLWMQENGDDAFDEINLIEPGFNSGWAQLMGPADRVAEFKAIETARAGGLQQNRWPATSLADTPAEALTRLYSQNNSRYADPQLSWRHALAPSPIGFVRGGGLGAGYEGDLLVGASRPSLYGGYLFRLKLAANRRSFTFSDARLNDRVADNYDKFDITESESLLVGRDFGVTTDIQSAPAGGGVYVLSLSNGALYEIYSARQSQLAKIKARLKQPLITPRAPEPPRRPVIKRRQPEDIDEPRFSPGRTKGVLRAEY